MRFTAYIGVLAVSLLIAVANAGGACADTDGAAGGEADTAAVTSKSDDNNAGAGASGASNSEPPSSTIGNGRADVDVQTREEDKKNNDAPATKKFKGSLVIPFFRIPRRAELPVSGLPNPSLFYTTIVIPVPTLGEFFAAMQAQPPTPAPGPTLRTQQQAPPVVDSAGSAAGGGGDGVDPLAVGVAAQPPVLQAPLVIAPLPIPLAPPAPPAAAPAPAPVVAADIAVPGASVPVVRGSVPPMVEPAAHPVTSMSAAPTRLGYPRELRAPTATEVTMLALPGIAGLLLLTVSGGCIGYRQANSARLLRSQAAARFLR